MNPETLQLYTNASCNPETQHKFNYAALNPYAYASCNIEPLLKLNSEQWIFTQMLSYARPQMQSWEHWTLTELRSCNTEPLHKCKPATLNPFTNAKICNTEPSRKCNKSPALQYWVFSLKPLNYNKLLPHCKNKMRSDCKCMRSLLGVWGGGAAGGTPLAPTNHNRHPSHMC